MCTLLATKIDWNFPANGSFPKIERVAGGARTTAHILASNNDPFIRIALKCIELKPELRSYRAEKSIYSPFLMRIMTLIHVAAA